MAGQGLQKRGWRINLSPTFSHSCGDSYLGAAEMWACVWQSIAGEKIDRDNVDRPQKAAPEFFVKRTFFLDNPQPEL